MKKKPDPFLIDDDSPEWTKADFKRARPLRDVFPELAEYSRRKKLGRPVKQDPKVSLTMRVDRDIAQWMKAKGTGYQTRINNLLRTIMETSQGV